MVNFDLPAISPDAHPEFTDATSCAEWLQSLPLINVGPSHGSLLGQLEELNACALPAGERLKVLELLREPVIFLQGEQEKKFIAKAIPLTRDEREILGNVLALWDAFSAGWRHCLQALESGDQELAGQGALICERVLWSAVQRMAEYYRAYQEFGSEEWRRLHSIYAYAERCGFADQEVSHPVRIGEAQTSCSETYAQALLLALANPNEQTARQQAIVSRWTERWARKAVIAVDPPPDPGIEPLSVDLDSGDGASRDRKEGRAVRYLHVDEIAKSVRRRVARLRNGDAPEALGLGSDVPAGLAGQILGMLYDQWCTHKDARTQPRRVTAKNVELCTGISVIHFHVTGQAFRQPGEARILTKEQRDEIATFGRVSTRREEEYVAVQRASLEQWNISDESLGGFRLARGKQAASGRFFLQQLAAVRPSDSRTFILCTVRWLSVSENYELRLGARAMPGMLQGIAIRPAGLKAYTETFVPGLALPAVPALQIPPSVIIPIGWYRPKRLFEVYGDKSEQILLSALLERGNDFDRCTFEPA
jgi:hypothetical protein